MVVETPTTLDGYRLLHQGSLVMARIEGNGIRIDEDALARAFAEVDSRAAEIEAGLLRDETWGVWKKTFGDRAKLGSGEQLTSVLFDVLKHPYNHDKTATGLYRADDQVILSVGLPFADDWLRLKKLVHLKSNSLEGIRRELVDGLLHPSFNLHTTRPFRSSSSEPNFQNLPIRDPEHGRLIRQCFVARPGRLLVEVDFKSIEVMLSCVYHKDPVLIEYVRDKSKDMHRDTAMELFLIPAKRVDKRATRDWSKNRFVFPQFYGSVWFQCAPHLWEAFGDGKYRLPGGGPPLVDHLAAKGYRGLGRCEVGQEPEPGTFAYRVREVERSFWGRRFQVYAAWKRRWFQDYLDRGYFDTLTGFRVTWGKGGPLKRNDATNYPIQGSAFHCLLMTLILLQRWLDKYKMKTLICGQIHDSLELDCPPDEVQDVLDKIHHIVTVELPRHWPWLVEVPLEVEVEVADVGQSWHDKRPWSCRDGVWGPVPKE